MWEGLSMVDIWNWVACGEQRQEEEDGGRIGTRL